MLFEALELNFGLVWFSYYKAGSYTKTFGDIDFSRKADIIGVEGMFKSLGRDLVKKS